MRELRPQPYLDDVFHSKGKMFDECLQILDDIFERLEKAGMQVNLSKSSIMGEEVELLGFMMTRKGSKPTAKRIEAILKLAPPKNVRGCRRIIGIINFIKNHIPGRTEKMRFLTEFTRKDVDFKWGAHEKKAFDKLKASVANSILITYLDPSKPFTYFPDASQKYACGGLVCQMQDGVMVTVGCHSKKWTPVERDSFS